MCFEFCPDGCPDCRSFLSAGRFLICKECIAVQKSFQSCVDFKVHNKLAAPPAGLKKDAKPLENTAFRFSSRIFLPSSPTLTEVSCFSTDSDSSSMEVDWVTDLLENEEQHTGTDIGSQEAANVVVRRQAKELQERVVSQPGANVQPVEVAINDVQGSNSMEEDYGSHADYSSVLLRQDNILECTVAELRECLIEALRNQQYDKYMLARTPVHTQGNTTPAEQDAERSEERTTWIKSGHKFSSQEAARQSSFSSFSGEAQSAHEQQALRVGVETGSSATEDDGDSDADGETDNEDWDDYDDDMFEVELNSEASDDVAESVYEPSHTDEDNASEMDVDSDEDVGVEPRGVQWTEARALW
ncbi:hypothetical protein QFC20_002265 [Naganishia adeliensis]|uniref:Uncharacterized protein n=1 Tax=Naganishia adeliensis TaxID=92952 RepID=A0ACC2WM14_9TREE|nr:hypothetical protein QFC20_002265 [Naganishia adeliensis]